MEYYLSGNSVKVTNADGKFSTAKFDSKNRPIEKKNSLGFFPRAVYNKEDELVSTFFADNRLTSYTFTPRGQIETITDLLSNTVRITYNCRNA